MQLNKPTKIIGGAVLTVVLGAIGSGVWENVFSPATSWIGRAMLTLITLGVESARDGIYQEVAQGHSERFSVLTYTFITAVVLLIPMGALSYDVGVRSAERSKRMRKFEQFEASGDRAGMEETLAEVRKSLGTARRQLRLMLWLGVALGIFVAAKTMTLAYANTAITHFNQSLAIAGPFVSPVEERMIRSDFARISSRDDYVRLMKRIDNKVSEQGVRLPEFSIW